MADNFLFTNNASALLAGNITDADTALSVETGFGALFPNPAGSQEFRCALQDADGNLEVIRVTARTGDNFTTIERAQEGTTAQSWTLGVTRVELRLTEETMEEFLQKNGGTMSGDLDMNENNLVGARINGANTVFEGGQIVGVPLRGAEDDSSNEIAVPDDGTRATASGSAILSQADLASNGGLNLLPINTIVMWYGAIANLPPGWQLCDGTNGTPDMRGNFPVGTGGSYSLGATGGAVTASGSTGSSGSHDHGASTGGHALTVSEMPAHAHKVFTSNNASGGITDNALRPTDNNVFGGRRGDASTTYHNTTTGGSGQLVEDTGGGSSHSHSISSDGAHTHTIASISTLPPYVALHFIMKVS